MADIQLTDDQIELLISKKRRPAIALLTTGEADERHASGCWMGGQPTLPSDIDWPVYKVPGMDIIIPHHFLMQINLVHVPRFLGMPALPEVGTLFVFYEQRIAPFVSVLNDELEPPLRNGEGVRVIYVDADVAECPERHPPEMPDFSIVPSDFQDAAHHFTTTAYKKERLSFVVYDSYPSTATCNAFEDSFLPRECSKRLRDLRDQINEDLIDLIPTSYEINGRIDSIFGFWQGQLLPTDEEVKRNNYNTLGAIGPNDIVLFRFGRSDIGKDSLNSFPECFWINKYDLINQNFDNVVVWEEN